MTVTGAPLGASTGRSSPSTTPRAGARCAPTTGVELLLPLHGDRRRHPHHRGRRRGPLRGRAGPPRPLGGRGTRSLTGTPSTPGAYDAVPGPRRAAAVGSAPAGLVAASAAARTKAIWSWVRASRRAAASSPRRSPTASSTAAMASMASWASSRSGLGWQVDGGQLVEAHDVVGDDLGRRAPRGSGAGPRPSRRSSPRPGPAPRGDEVVERRATPAQARRRRRSGRSGRGSVPGRGSALDGHLAAGGPQAHDRRLLEGVVRGRRAAAAGPAGSDARCRRVGLGTRTALTTEGKRGSAPTRPPDARSGAGTVRRVDLFVDCRPCGRVASTGVGFPTPASFVFGGALAVRPSSTAPRREQRIDEE